MRRLPIAAALLALAASAPAFAVEISERVFQVAFNDGGEEHLSEDPRVPYLPGNACYSWYLRADPPGAGITVVERLTLPQPIDWGTTGATPDDPTQIEDDGRVAVTTLAATTDSSGWFTHGWCVAAGDPLGAHEIEISVDGAPAASFPFEVVSASDYGLPATFLPQRTHRSVNDSW